MAENACHAKDFMIFYYGYQGGPLELIDFYERLQEKEETHNGFGKSYRERER